jgi:ATP-binding cassette subfamily C protein
VTAVVVTLRPALLNSVDKVLILRAGRAEAFGSPSEVLHRLVRASGRANENKPEQPRRIESSGHEVTSAGGQE